jgi:outer membrane lipoprotein-sorting protein
MRVACLLIVSLLTLSAQQFPDASALLESSVGALKTYNTYEFTEVTTGGPGMEQAMLHQGTSSGKTRMSQKIGGIDGVLIVSDGKNMWMYMAMMKRYMKMPTDAGAMEGMAQAMAGFQAGMANLKPKVLRSETLDVDGEPHDCWVVESRTPGFAVAGAAMKESVQTHWIDKISSIDFKTAITASVQVPGQKEAIDTSTTVSRHGYKFNPPLDDALFVFTPPAGATETDELFPGMKDMFAKPEPTPSAKTSAAVPMASEPRAFVPSLTPVERTEAALPQSVDKGLRAMVQVLVTIDPAGNVVKAEPLNGAEVLRKAAVDAVLHWKFRPVIRDGTAVYAYTEAMVDFTDYSKP